jgi:predicted methyltransferase
MKIATSLVLALAVAACGGGSGDAAPPPASPTSSAGSSAPPKPAKPSIGEAARAAVAAPDRSEADRALDAGRHPAEMLAFFGIDPGMRVGEISAGLGYTTELIARLVGPQGKVYAQNSKVILERFAEKPWSERLAKPINANVVRSDRELEDPFPPEAKELDAVLDVLFYHDSVWMKADRAKMNQSIFAALKHGGVYGIVDHSAKDGAGTSEAQTLHRIEEKVVREEVEKAGFKLAASADFLKNPSDPRDWNASPRQAAEKRGTSDRFVLKFVKP